MFVLEEKPLVWWPVTVREPDPAKPGAIVENTFVMQFEVLPREEAMRIMAEARRAAIAAESTEIDPGNDALLRVVSKDWKDVVDAGGNGVPFSPATFGSAWQRLTVRTGINEAYAQVINGEAARLGN